MINVLTIDTSSSCQCECIEKIAYTSNTIRLIFIIGDVEKYNIELYTGSGTYIRGITGPKPSVDITFDINTSDFPEGEGVLKVKYSDTTHTGEDFVFNFPADHTGSIYLEATDNFNYNVVYCDKDVSNFKSLVDKIYPVGSIYMSVNNVNPGDLFCGTWVAWGSGRVPVCVNSSDSSFNTVEKTGGAKTITLTVEQLPSHSHEEKIAYYSNDLFIRPMASSLSEEDSGTNKILKGEMISRSSETGPLKTGESGSGKSHNNLQPYITCYMWKRTA